VRKAQRLAPPPWRKNILHAPISIQVCYHLCRHIYPFNWLLRVLRRFRRLWLVIRMMIMMWWRPGLAAAAAGVRSHVIRHRRSVSTPKFCKRIFNRHHTSELMRTERSREPLHVFCFFALQYYFDFVYYLLLLFYFYRFSLSCLPLANKRVH